MAESNQKALAQTPAGTTEPAIRICVQNADFDLAAEYAALRQHNRQIGAIATFTGLVREFEANTAEPLSSLELEHYPGMTEKLIAEIVQQAAQRWPLHAVTVIHRVGELQPADQIVLVGVAASHRDAAFSAAEWVMDFLKTRATFWKRVTENGSARWVEAKESDQRAADRWESAP